MNPEQTGRILVIGATGTIGREVVTHLLAAAVPVRALSRDPAKAGAHPGVEAVAGDLTIPESLDRGLEGVETVFLVWTAPAEAIPGAIARIAKHARRLVLLSSPHQTPHPMFQQPNPMAAMHAALEREILASGLETTILRPGMFASNAAMWWGRQIRDGNVVRWPYAAAASAPADERDIAEVAALALRDAAHAGRDSVLTGPESLTHQQQVGIIARVIGRDVGYEEMEPDAFREMLAGNAPPAVADMLLNAWRASVGVPAYVTSSVAEITGRPARPFEQWARDHADTFTPA